MDFLGVPFIFPGAPSVKILFQTPRVYQDQLGASPNDLQGAPGSEKGFASRQEILKSIGASALVEVRQVHGCELIFDPKETFVAGSSRIEENFLEEADGICSKEKGLALLIKTADCQPLFLSDKKGTCIAALHVGWRGNRAAFPKKAVKLFCDRYRLAAEEVLAARGPSLSRGRAQFTNFQEEWGDAFEPWFCEEDQTMDLWRLTRDQLMDAGVLKENIFSVDLCTYDLPDLFFSYRRDRTSGRQGSLIWIEP